MTATAWQVDELKKLIKQAKKRPKIAKKVDLKALKRLVDELDDDVWRVA
jgi:hypothetical protein